MLSGITNIRTQLFISVRDYPRTRILAPALYNVLHLYPLTTHMSSMNLELYETVLA
jgi:hypothetical protein